MVGDIIISHQNFHCLLVGMKISALSLEISLIVSYKVKNTPKI